MLEMNKTIYLDHASTTAARPEVVEAMLPYFTEKYGNPSSIYDLGAQNKGVITQARETIAASLACAPENIYFTAIYQKKHSIVWFNSHVVLFILKNKPSKGECSEQ